MFGAYRLSIASKFPSFRIGAERPARGNVFTAALPRPPVHPKFGYPSQHPAAFSHSI
jgi:hypothetical protein